MGKIGRNKSNIGITGEEIACKYLLSKGYTIIDRNFKTFHGELDIVYEKEGMLFFGEVKTVSQDKHSIDPTQNFTQSKYLKMTRAIEYYLLSKRAKHLFETSLICVYVDKENKTARVQLIKNPIY